VSNTAFKSHKINEDMIGYPFGRENEQNYRVFFEREFWTKRTFYDNLKKILLSLSLFSTLLILLIPIKN